MIYSIRGTPQVIGENFLVLSVGGIGFKIFLSSRALEKARDAGGELLIFTHLHVKEDALDLYGFLEENELRFFELLISVSGVGPKSALAILDVAEIKNLLAAIKENRPDLLTHASGIGRKTAERIILELRGKVKSGGSEGVVKTMQADEDIVEALVGLGYRRGDAKAALGKIDEKTTGMEARLKAALKVLGGR